MKDILPLTAKMSFFTHRPHYIYDNNDEERAEIKADNEFAEFLTTAANAHPGLLEIAARHNYIHFSDLSVSWDDAPDKDHWRDKALAEALSLAKGE